ncbi:hypothetical protein GLE_3590 [Lysobacter enzymogenes]|uniref:Uncharacterized protein n=1 Tax=Lysobacter enzymogenes TaxID=69 RepID=A0A0S2DJZ6_LYSEN|nr:hypothetical protein GLE_3590 [Lysobacter enzymogenes]QCW27190.1 hypothetical protein FE772_17690 [Lysobacter enzymogenes]
MRGGPIGWLLVAHFVGALLSLISIEPGCCLFVPEEPDHDRVWRWLLLFWLALAAFSLVRHWPMWSWRSPAWMALLAPWVLAFLLAAFSWPYVYAANALAGSDAVRFDGVAIDRWEEDGRSPTYGVYLRDARSGAVVSLRIDRHEYAALRTGDRAVCDYRRGRLGFYFRWRLGAPQACRFERS